ncbi:unnamed protein product [Caenorhabditis angaria]|uniref:SOSS complex subunit A homolog n=1 Tax=Caenorhabditis angaria TaxID=860376 RepID=A0A9P1I940_9PELO|nr:unnamed protein product [Caenorhabditis angaria]
MNEELAKRIHRMIKVNLKMENPSDVVKKFAIDSSQLDEKLHNLSDKEAIDLLISKDKGDSSSSGVVYHLVTSYDNPEKFSKMMKYILGAGVDYWHTILCNLNMILIEVWHLIHLGCKEQLVRLIREGIRLNVKSIENVLMNVFKNISGSGDWQTKVRIMNMLMNTIREHEPWFKSIKSGAGLMSTIIMVTSHIIVDTPQPITKEDQFKNQLIVFLTFVIRSRKLDCHALGRDFVIIIARLGRIPQFEEIWRELHQTPGNFGISSIEEFISRPNIVGLLRLSTELQRKIDHIVFYSKNNLIIYYDWIVKSHLRQLDSGSLRAEIVRYLCSMSIDAKNHGPAVFENRIQLLHLLVSTAPPGPEQQWLKLCLFVEWFGCDERFVNYNNSNVEIAINLVRYSLSIQAPPPSQNSIIQASHCSPFANSLLEYLCKSVDLFLPSQSDQIRKNVNTAMKFCRDRFQHGLQQILENYKIDRKIGDQMRQIWPDFMRSSQNPPKKLKKPAQNPPEDTKITVATVATVTQPQYISEPILTAAEKKKLAEKEEMELESSMKLLKGEIREKIEGLKSQWKEFSDDADKCEAVETILTHLCKNDDKLDDSQQEIAAQCLLAIMGSVVVEEKSLLPETNEISEAFTHPIYSIFKMLCFPPNDDSNASEIMVNLMAAMREKDASLTYVFLYYIKGSDTRTQDTIEIYREIARVSDKNVDEMLCSDIQLCALNDIRLFAYLIPFIFSQFQDEVFQSSELLNVLCANLDSSQLRVFISEMIREEIKLFKKDTFSAHILASVEWPTSSQWIFWHLVHADGVPIEWFLPIIPKLDAAKHDEAIANILLMLKHMDREPWPGLIRSIFSRIPGKDDNFTIDALKVLIDDAEQCQRVAELVGGLIKKLIANNEILGIGTKTTPNTKKAAPTKVSLQQLLEHLTQFSDACLEKKQRATEMFLSKHYMQEAFSSIKTNDKSSVLTKKYHNLFGVMDILAADLKEQNSRQLRGNRQGSAAEKSASSSPAKRKTENEETDSNSKRRKCQKDIIQLDDSDSD